MGAVTTPSPSDRPVAFVTGSSRGIGRATALALARRGYQVVLHGRTREGLDEARRAILETGAPEPAIVAYDVGDAAAIKGAFAEIHGRWRRLDVLVNNAGILEPAPMSMITADHVERVLRTNAAAVLLHMHYAARLMARRKRGAIVNLTSIMGTRGAAGYAVYSASKAAVVGATLAAAKELASIGIRVNAVAPGYVDTDMTRGLQDSEREATLAAIPLGRAASAEDVAAVVAFLASDEAEYVTGQVVGVDGGFRV